MTDVEEFEATLIDDKWKRRSERGRKKVGAKSESHQMYAMLKLDGSCVINIDTYNMEDTSLGGTTIKDEMPYPSLSIFIHISLHKS